MSQLLFWPTIIYFYPIGNTSAVCLTENLPPESKADVLLLACGDPRHILYTIYANETNPLTCSRTIDITCCDVDVAILARNVLLFTLLADDGALDKLDNMWNLFYHMFIDQTSLSILFKQCRKLVALAENAETWRAGPYGHFLITCDARTLAELRRMWTAYLDTAAYSSKQTKQFEQRFVDGMKETSRKRRSGSTAARSAGPFASHANHAVSNQFSSYWSSGITDDGTQGRGQKRNLKVNPTFAFSIDGDMFAVHYATDPLGGFHLAEAFASGKFTRPDERMPPHEMVHIAKDQFSHWCTSMNKHLKNSNPSSPTIIIRMFAGEALRFCQALTHCEVMRSPVTPYNVSAWQLSTVALDDYYYGHSAVSPAPLSFNVIDTSNIMDHVGLVNLLVVTAPLLCKTPSATLYTEALLRTGDDPLQTILEDVCGDVPTMALLLGIIPSTFISQFTTRSNVYESEGAKYYHERLAWKAIGFGGPGMQYGSEDVPLPPQRLFFPPEDLARLFLRVYVQMFSDEDIKSRFSHLSFSPERMLQKLQRSGILYYNRRSFALLVHFVKSRVQTDWWRAMHLFEGSVLSDQRLIMGQHAYQELCCQLYLLGVYTPEWMSIPGLRRICPDYEIGRTRLFRDWTQSHIPLVVSFVLVVPREAVARLEPDFMNVGTPLLQCDMHDKPRQNLFAVTSATFGSLRVSGKGEHRTAVVVENRSETMQPPWRTGAPLVITFSVPSSSLMDFARNPRATVGLVLRATPGVTFKFMARLGTDLTVFRTELTDVERVFLLAQPPVVGTNASMSTDADAGAGAVTTGVSQENIRGDSHSAQSASSSTDMSQRTIADVHVQMNNMSSAIQSFTVRINVTNPDARSALADPQTDPTVNSSSGLTQSLDACVRIRTHTFLLHFPLPVDVARAKRRIARRSSYVEVIVPLASFDVRPERDLESRFAPLFLGPNDDYTPTLGSIHRLHLDRCPTFKLPKGPSKFDWYDLHTSLMFSATETRRVVRSNNKPLAEGRSTSVPTPDALLRVKRTLHLLLRSAVGADGAAPESAFALCDTSRREVALQYFYIIIARMCLDVGSHTVVADAFVAPGTPEVRTALLTAIRDTSTGGNERWPRRPDDQIIRCIGTTADETAAWFHLLPRLAERCRTWPHKTGCAYHTTKGDEQKREEENLGLWGARNPLCTCGAGIGTKILPKAFKRAAPYLTRAAISPLISVPYLREVDEPVGMTQPQEVATPQTSLEDGNTNISEVNAVGEKNRCRPCGKEGSLICSRCKRVRYCSKECQHADWKVHKKDCRSNLA